ncbi:hypothetical protein M2650_05080 [Luteimonas sp. SX5]|uniref:Uncharacterized protein n=1 Tax=Luteimonas galliterrae TaxID=2940486 RepID=A0ABT0MI89_9GAMM|nr:hypothetical protein [Luteimonas galliterrae]MCL1634015.1 hypothetical protein [Luteimonas galliterrae]
MNISTKFALAALASIAMTPPTAHAEQIALAIAGQVKSVTGNASVVNGHVHVGDAVTGYYVFDTETADGNPSPLQGVYRHTGPEYGMAAEINGLRFESDPASVDFTLTLENDLWGPGRGDSARLASKHNLFGPGVPAASTDMTISLYERNSTALSSDALSAEALLAPQWYAPQASPFAQSARLSIYGSDGGSKFLVEVTITHAERIDLPGSM